MSEDSPIEFRAAKRGLSVADWLAGQSRRDAAIYAGAAVLLLFCSAMAAVATYIFAFLVIWTLTYAVCGLGRSWSYLPALAAVIGLFFLQRRFDGDDAELVTVDAGSRGTVKLCLSRLTGSSWLMFLDRPSVDLNPVARLGLNLAFLVPRLFRVSWRMWGLSRQMNSMNVPAVSAALDTLMQAGGRIGIGDLLQEFPNQDPQSLIADLTSVDGVILLASDPPGLTLSPSFSEDFDAWKRSVRQKRRGEKS